MRDRPNERGAEELTEEKREASTLIASGVGVLAIGAFGAVVGGAVCPLCVVAAPALLGVGAFKRWKASRPRRRR